MCEVSEQSCRSEVGVITGARGTTVIKGDSKWPT